MLKKLFHYFNKNQESSNTKNFSVTISLDQNEKISVDLKYPELQNIKINDIPDIAEMSAELLLYSCSSLCQKKILSDLADKYYDTDNLKNKLFFDNLISFYNIIKTNIKESSNLNQPLIRPTAVFNTK
jgi:hypothetical protein